MTDEIKPHIWFSLYQLLRLGANTNFLRISTTELSRVIGGSQQSASRHLQILDSQGFIERKIERGGSHIRITGKGLDELTHVYGELKWYLEGKQAETIVIMGEVSSGLFEGAYYISKEGYMRQIEERLGFTPFPGTLNVKIPEDDYDARRNIERGPGIRLEGFKDGERAFGAARCYPLTLNDEEAGAMIVAERTTHDLGVMEIISPHYLRRKLGLVDGDTVKVSFEPLRRSDA